MRRHLLLVALTMGVAAPAFAQRQHASVPLPPPPRGPSSGPKALLWGFAVDCTRCSFNPVERDPRPIWRYAEPPRIAAVTRGGAAAVAGVQEGDTILLVDSLSILSHDGARRFSSVRPGDRVRLTLRRGGRTVDAILQLGRSPGPPPPLPSRTPQSRRYTGEVGGAAVEVWSATAIAVEVDSTGALVIQAGASTVRVTPKTAVTAMSRTSTAVPQRP